jgi:hypothetical protein
MFLVKLWNAVGATSATALLLMGTAAMAQTTVRINISLTQDSHQAVGEDDRSGPQPGHPWCCQGQSARSSDRDLSQADFIKPSGHGYRAQRPET